MQKNIIDFDIHGAQSQDFGELEHYQQMFMNLCKENLPGADNRLTAIYFMCLAASQSFAVEVIEGSTIDAAYQRSINMLFNTANAN